MDGSLDQLMRLLSNRGLEWLRQRIMALPDPLTLDDPNLGALARVGQMAPVLSGLRGRISPIEVIVLRRMTPELVQAGAQRVLSGARDDALVRLMLAGGLVAQDDPLWQLACEELADDDTLPLPHKLALSDDPAVLNKAETLLTTVPLCITADHVSMMTQLLMQLYHHGARRPRLSHPRAFTQIFDHLRLLAGWAQKARCTVSVARIAFCLQLLDGDHPVAEMVSDMIQMQRPDGSFPVRLGFGTEDQQFGDAVEPTVMVSMALHMSAWRGWHGPPPVWLQPHPLRAVARQLADRIALQSIPARLTLHVATSLTRATGGNWLANMSAPGIATAAQISGLARICFRDATSARHVRAWLALSRKTARPDGLAGTEAAWLVGSPVAIEHPLSDALAAQWEQAAQSDNVDGFLTCARIALHHAGGPGTPAIRAMTRRLTVKAMNPDASLPQMLDSLDQLTLLSHLFEPEAQTSVAAA